MQKRVSTLTKTYTARLFESTTARTNYAYATLANLTAITLLSIEWPLVCREAKFLHCSVPMVQVRLSIIQSAIVTTAKETHANTEQENQLPYRQSEAT
jgi:hypothetical protein